MGVVPRIVSLVPKRFEDGGWAGVPRFDWELRRVFPTMLSLNTRWHSLLRLRWIAARTPDTIVITGNETSLLVPDSLRTIVVHHGSAKTHFDRDPGWRDRQSQRWCRAQREMYRRPNRWFVASARWTAEQFALHYGVPMASVIPHWVERLENASGPSRRTSPLPRGRRVVLGDFRTVNKGRDVVPALARRMPEFEFRNLACTYGTRRTAYAAADAYLGLSLSEGGSYALSDAEGAAIPIVMTDVGNCHEYDQAHVIRWQARDDPEVVAAALSSALSRPRGPSFFESWTLERWGDSWRRLVAEVAEQSGCLPVIP